MRKFIKILLINLILFSLNSESALAYFFNYYQEKTDSLNRIDENGLKQGIWIIYNKSGDKIVEKGTYIDNKKEGVWTNYFANETIKNKITYITGKPRGKACFYYDNGQLREMGNWDMDHWVGEYQYYYKSGQISYDWNYNKYGKREGEQKYYYTNGEKMYEGSWKNGKTDGYLKVYNDKGELIQKKFFNNGIFAEIKKVEPAIERAIPSVKKENQDVELNKFKKTGFHTIFNLSGKIIKKGFFVKGDLFNGEEYLYNEEDTLIKVLIFENGKLKNSIEKTD